MADLSDVIASLGMMCSSALYPGQVTPSGASPTAGVPVLVQDGWPVPANLDKMAADAALSPPNVHGQVTVYPRTVERNTTRYPREWIAGDLQAKTFTLTQSAQNITVGGVQPSTFYQQNVCVFVNRKAYIYSTQAGDDVNSIAAGLAALIAVDVPGTGAAGAVLAIPSPAIIGSLRVGTGAPIIQEIKRQEREFQLTIWAPTLASRDAIAKPIDVAIAINQWLTFPDGTRGRLIYKGSPYTDFDQKQGVYRRDLIVTVEYPTLNIDLGVEVVAIQTEMFLNGSKDNLVTETPDDIATETGSEIVVTPADQTTFT